MRKTVMYGQQETNDGGQDLCHREPCLRTTARGPLTLACRQNKTCRRRLRHNVVAPTLAAPLLTDTRRSTVGSGTRENIVTEPENKGRRPTSSVPDTYAVIQAGLLVRFETHNGIRGGVVRRCVAHHVRSLLLLARRSLYVSDGTHIKKLFHRARFLSRSGITWRTSGTTLSPTSSGLCLRNIPSCSRKVL